MTEQISIMLRLEAGLLAFILAFYALCARERRAPYITHTAYAETGLVLFAVLFTLFALLVSDTVPILHSVLRFVAQVILGVAVLATLRRVFVIANRDLRLRDDKWWLVLPGIKQGYLWNRRRKHETAAGMSYEHQSLRPSTELTGAIVEAGWPPPDAGKDSSPDGRMEGGPEESATLTLIAASHQSSDPHLVDLSGRFLREGAYIQYTPCARHPTEFLVKLKSYWERDSTGKASGTWKQIASRVVTVDAYTPHFGFHDSVHEVRARFIERQLGVKVISCRPTFAGIHTATAEAFNWIKSKEGEKENGVRKPSLLIFEGAYALVDLESPELYRRFWRHVIPSERMWGSMFTLVTELCIDEESKALLRSYSDFFLDKSGQERVGNGGT